MYNVSVKIVKSLDFSVCPELVECVLVDAYGRCHVFRDKAAIFSSQNITQNALPTDGVIRCEVMCKTSEDIVRITTKKPDAIESTEGNVVFDVFAKQIARA